MKVGFQENIQRSTVMKDDSVSEFVFDKCFIHLPRLVWRSLFRRGDSADDRTINGEAQREINTWIPRPMTSSACWTDVSRDHIE